MTQENKDVALIKASDLSLVGGNLLNEKQLAFILKRTPKQYVRRRPAKGGGEWEYVSGGYIKKVLNLVFGWNWSFEIMEQLVMHDEAIVKGKLTVMVEDKAVVKMQFGNKDIIYKKAPNEKGERVPLSIGNDLKAASTDALKKCAAELGICADIYNPQEFREVSISADGEVTAESLFFLYQQKETLLSEDEKIHAMRIINNNEKNSFDKLQTLLNSKK